jgi:hypothetical protein
MISTSAVLLRRLTLFDDTLKNLRSGLDKGPIIEDAYARSFVHAVGKELGKQCRALVLVIPQEVEDKTSEEFPTIKVHRLRPIEYYAHTRDGIEDAKRAGAADGMDASMMRPIQHHE